MSEFSETNNHKTQLDALKKIIRDPCRISLFVGSGISMSAPTNMPSWGNFTQEGLGIAAKKGLSERAKGYAEELLSKRDFYGVFDLLKKEMAEPVYNGIVEELLPHQVANANHNLIA